TFDFVRHHAGEMPTNRAIGDPLPAFCSVRGRAPALPGAIGEEGLGRGRRAPPTFYAGGRRPQPQRYPGRCGIPPATVAAPRGEPDEARARRAPERTRLYVRTRNERERSQATLIGAALPRPLRNPVLPHLRVQRGAAKAEQRGRGLLVPA